MKPQFLIAVSIVFLTLASTYAYENLSNDKYQAVLKAYTGTEKLDEKNKKVDEISKDYTESEKKIVESIKAFFKLRAKAISTISTETKDILHEIKELRNKQKAAFARVSASDKKAAKFLLFAKPPNHVNTPGSPATTQSPDEAVDDFS
uniref:DUF148 domain-containing protein n=1 Tax=Panagrellus redivivus TaxID=6233 RepID=A0A7E4VUY3_PANRE